MGLENKVNRKEKTGSERNEIRELIRRVRQGEQEAFSSLLERYRPLIEAAVYRFRSDDQFSLYEDDLRQEATVVFYHAILSFELEQDEVEFGLYAKICISNALVSQLRLQRKRVAEQAFPIADTVWNGEKSEDPSERLLERERAEALYAEIKRHLSVFEYRVWRYYMSGRTAKEIGMCVGKDEKSIANAIYRIRKKLRSALQSPFYE